MSSAIDEDKAGIVEEDETLIELMRSSVVVNAKIASAESLDCGFPNASLYSMYRAFDYIAAAFDPKPHFDQKGELITAQRFLNAADAMLMVAYLHASSMIGDYYKESYDELAKRVASVDVSAYEHDSSGPVWRLRETEKRYEQVVASFKNTMIYYSDESLEDMSARATAADKSERRRLMDLADEWSAACKERYNAMCDALPIFESGQTRRDPILEGVEKTVDAIDTAITVSEAADLTSGFLG